MNGFVYGPTTNSYLPANQTNTDLIQSARYVPRQPHTILQEKADIKPGGDVGGCYDTLINGGAMYDNWNTIWTPKNRGGIELSQPKFEGPYNGGVYDNTPKNNTLPFQSTFRKPYYNPVT